MKKVLMTLVAMTALVLSTGCTTMTMCDKVYVVDNVPGVGGMCERSLFSKGK